ncbi:MAG: DNA replication/repair protein RecF [Firmicutes bacterium]|nr:DNA replication/repair protein RecF [Bacillota bacterium]
MFLKQLSLVNYRNYSRLELECHPGINVFHGDNAQGKSNLIEAIYYLGMGKAYRTGNDDSLVRWGEESFRIKAELVKSNQLLLEEIGFSFTQRKAIKVNGQKVNSFRSLPALFPLVLFSPDDLQLIKGNPVFRRTYLDEILGVLYPGFQEANSGYRRALTQRNNLLRRAGGPGDEELEPWERLLSEQGGRIIAYRLYLLPMLGNSIRGFFSEISSGGDPLEVNYYSSIPSIWQTSLSASCTIEYYLGEVAKTIEDYLAAAYVNQRGMDRKRGLTSLGPHRDDLVFRLKGKEVKHYASQGQQRAATLALRLAQLKLLDEGLRERPILLLDDVFSELDENHRDSLLKNLSLERQVFITTTSTDQIPNWEAIRGGAHCWRVREGRLNPEDPVLDRESYG